MTVAIWQIDFAKKIVKLWQKGKNKKSQSLSGFRVAAPPEAIGLTENHLHEVKLIISQVYTEAQSLAIFMDHMITLV